MTLSLALRRATSPSLYTKLINPIRSAYVTRSFNTNSQLTDSTEDDDQDVYADYRRHFYPSVTSVTSPSSPLTTRVASSSTAMFTSSFPSPGMSIRSPRSFSHECGAHLDYLHYITAKHYRQGSQGGPCIRAKRNEDALTLRMDMPGLGKEDVNIVVEDDATLVVKGEGEEGDVTEEFARRVFLGKFELNADLLKIDEIKAEMKNGVLKVVVPIANKVNNVRQVVVT
ncbi:hypothetical protein ACFE04_028816 [Oxalis oulophora]